LGKLSADFVNYFTLSILRVLFEPLGFKLLESERKYMFGYLMGVWWKDPILAALARIGMHSIVTTHWRKL